MVRAQSLPSGFRTGDLLKRSGRRSADKPVETFGLSSRRFAELKA
jgi:hypothetical protein